MSESSDSSESTDNSANPDNTGNESPRKGHSRWIWIALITSLSLNFLIIGAVGGALFAKRHDGPAFKERKGSQGFRSFLRSLPEERRQLVRDFLKQHRQTTRSMWQEVRKSRRESAEIIRTEPFDETRFLESLNRTRELELQARSASQPALVELIQKLEPQERQRLLRLFGRKILGRDGRPPRRSDRDR